MNDLKDIKNRLDAASPGPWRALTGAKQRSHEAHIGQADSAVFPLVLSNNEYVLGEISPWMLDADRALVVNAREDIERLYRSVQIARDHLRAVVAGKADHDGAWAGARAYLQSVEKP